ncbi:MAG: glycoside hydrolase family 3 N-terminal domain-containing protein [Gemmatimonadales bacterium]
MTVARLVLPALRWSPARRAYLLEGAQDASAALELGVGGFILFGGTADAAHHTITELQDRAGHPLLFGSDLERGAGQQFEGLSEWPPPAALATLGLDTVRAAARATAREALALGITWIFAPVADLDLEPENPIVQTRAFGGEPAGVAACVEAWVRTAQAEGALACVKHFPGHGRTRHDSHREVPSVNAGRDALDLDLTPFRAGIQAGVASVMTAHVRYPALDPSGTPATASGPILHLLRDELGFRGLVVTDALIMEAALAAGGPAAQIGAGVDLLLYPRDIASTVAAIDEGMHGGALSEMRVVEALHRYESAVARLEAGRESRAAIGGSRAEGRGSSAGAAAAADELLAARTLRGRPPRLTAPIELTLIDDDIGGPYPASPSDWLELQLDALGVRMAGAAQELAGTTSGGRRSGRRQAGRKATGSKVVAAFCEPRGWKGRAGFGERTRAELAAAAPGADLVLLFGHPRLVDEIPGTGPVACAWHRQRPMQEAAARLLSRLLG